MQKPTLKTFVRENIDTQYINQDARREYKEKLIIAETFINNELIPALKAESLPNDLKMITELSKAPDTINQIIHKHKTAYLKTLGFVPVKEKERIESNYNEVATRLEKLNKELYDYCKQYPFTLTQCKDKTITFDQTEVDKHIDTIGVRIFSPIEIEYINLLQDASEILIKARDIELENGYVPYALGYGVPFGNSFMIVGLQTDLTQGNSIVKHFTKKQTFKSLQRLEEEKNNN